MIQRLLLQSTLVLLLFYSFNNLTAQACIQPCAQLNEDNTIELDMGTSTWTNLHLAIRDELVPGWHAAIGTPHLFYIDDNQNCMRGTYMPNDFPISDLRNCLGTSVNLDQTQHLPESIYTDFNFDQNGHRSYCIELDVELINENCFGGTISDRVILMTYAANDLIHFQETTYFTDTAMPVETEGTDKQLIGDNMAVGFNQVHTLHYDFDPMHSFTQLEIFPVLDIYSGLPVAQIGLVEIVNVDIYCQTEAVNDITYTTNELTYSFEAGNLGDAPYDEILWDFGDGNFSMDAAPTHTFAQLGSYNVCVDVIDDIECCGTYCEEIIVTELECIPTSETIVLDSYLSQYAINGQLFLSDLIGNVLPPTELNGGELIVKGSLVIDIPYRLNGCSFQCEPGAEIILDNGTYTRFNNSSFVGCTKMWKGISVESNSKLLFFGGLVSDAEYGINLKNDTQLNSHDVVYDKNAVGIYNLSINPVESITISLTHNEFICTGLLLPAYSGQYFYPDNFNDPNTPDKITYAGVWVNNIGQNVNLVSRAVFPDFDSKAYNVFDGIRNGIIAYKCRLQVHGNTFKNLQGRDYFYNISGFGIRSTRSTGESKITENSFKEFYEGVDFRLSSNCKVEIHQNNFTYLPGTIYYKCGVRINRVENSQINISSNNFKNIRGRDLFVSQCHNLNSLDIEYNNFNSDSYLVSNLGMLSCNLPANLANVSNNNFSVIAFKNGAAGRINLNLVNNLTAVGNEFLESANQGAISPMVQLHGSSKCLFRSNISDAHESTFSSSLSMDNTFCCNEIQSGRNGFSFQGNCMNTNFKQNDIEANIALNLQDAQVSGPAVNMEHNGNLYRGGMNSRARISAISGIFGTEADIAAINQFKINPVEIDIKPFSVTPDVLKNTLFSDVFSGTSKTCDELVDCGIEPYQLKPNEGGVYDVIDPTGGEDDCTKGILAEWSFMSNEDNILDGDYGAQNRWSTGLYLYEELLKYNPEYWEHCESIWSFYDEQTDIAAYADVANIFDEVYQQNEEQYNSSLEIQDGIMSVNHQLEDLYNSFEDNEGDEGQLLELSDLQNEMEAYVLDLDQLKAELQDHQITKADEALSAISELNEPFYFLGDQKKVWMTKANIILEGVEYITDVEIQELETIANHCPLEYGKPVYEARSLLEDITGNNVEYGSVTSLCEPNENDSDNFTSVSDNVTNGEALIYPNPAVELITVDVTKDMLGATIEIRNVNGEILLMQKLIVEKNKIDVKALSSGIYIVNVVDNNGSELSTKKLIIAK